MMDAFQTLGVPAGLRFSEDDLREAFRAAGKSVHPDGGGAEGDFAALKEAMAILSSPSRRLRHWMELQGVPVEPRGTIGGGMMDLFAVVGAVTQSAESILRRREAARSALSKALLESPAQVAREEVESAIARIDATIESQCEPFGEWEASGHGGRVEAIEQVIRNLAFLEKWKAGLRALYSRLI